SRSVVSTRPDGPRGSAGSWPSCSRSITGSVSTDAADVHGGAPAAGPGRRAGPSDHPRTRAQMGGATIVASDSIMKRGESTPSLPQEIFSAGGAPEYEP